jgi:hypothetical protein
MKGAAHLQPVTWEGAEEGVIARFEGQGKLDGDGFSGLGEGSVDDDVVAIVRDVVFLQGSGVCDHRGGEGAYGVDFAWFDEHKVMRLLGGGLGVIESEGDDGACWGGELGFIVGQWDGGVGFELDRDCAHLLSGGGADEGGHSEKSEEWGGHEGDASLNDSQWRCGGWDFK